MSLRWKIALGFALVALATAAVIALATPPIVTQGFADIDRDSDAGPPAASAAAQAATIVRLLLAAAGAALAASLLGLLAAGRLVRPLSRLEEAAGAVARGHLERRSGLAERSDEFGQLGRTFDSMAGQLQAADEMRRRFLQDAAHELRTPLAVIDATSSAILDGVYTPERRHIETIRDQSRVLARIVDDLRTISLAEGGNLPLDRQRQDVRRALESVAAGFEAPDGIVVEADPDRLRQMLGALVDNALRHTPAGGTVRMVASASRAPAEAGSPRPVARLAVEDSGSGIPEEALPRVFERFFQADPSRSRGSGTSGLGLSIVRALAEAQGARVGAENRAEGGARLWIELPAVRPTRRGAPTPPPR
jgi:two-component system sensor histidine kinase BaeS